MMDDSIKPKKDFHLQIEKYYIDVSNNNLPKELLNEIIELVTDNIYNDYKRFWNQYPKSKKRYSTLKLEDVKHSFINHLITNYLKKCNLPEYRYYSKVLFKMNDSEFDEYEKAKFNYETM